MVDYPREYKEVAERLEEAIYEAKKIQSYRSTELHARSFAVAITQLETSLLWMEKAVEDASIHSTD